MKAIHLMCGRQENSDIIFGPERHFGWHSCSAPWNYKLSFLLSILRPPRTHNSAG